MKMQLNLLTSSEQEFHWVVPNEWLQEQLEKDKTQDELEANLFRTEKEIEIDIWIYRNESEVYFRSTCIGSLKSTCVRCLEEHSLPLKLTFGGVFNQKDFGEEHEPDDPSQYYYKNDTIHFGSALLENIFLNLPLSPTCENAGEECGYQAPVHHSFAEPKEEKEQKKLDPRWAALKQIQKKMNKN